MRWPKAPLRRVTRRVEIVEPPVAPWVPWPLRTWVETLECGHSETYLVHQYLRALDPEPPAAPPQHRRCPDCAIALGYPGLWRGQFYPDRREEVKLQNQQKGAAA